MSGNRYLLDTNAVIALLQNAEWSGISVISQLEFIVFIGLTEADKQLFQQFLRRVEIIDLSSQNSSLIEQIVLIRQQYRLKLPDATIAAMAIQESTKLVTRDVRLNRVAELTIVDW